MALKIRLARGGSLSAWVDHEGTPAPTVPGLGADGAARPASRRRAPGAPTTTSDRLRPPRPGPDFALCRTKYLT